MSPSKIQLNKYYYRESYNYTFVYYFYKKDENLYYYKGRAESTTQQDDGIHYYFDIGFPEDRGDMPYDLYVLKDKVMIAEFNKKMIQHFIKYIKGCFTGENSFTPYYFTAIGCFPTGRHDIIREIFYDHI